MEPVVVDKALPRLGDASSRMLRTVLDQSLDCIKVIDGDGRLAFMNQNGLCAMEIDDYGAVDGARWSSLWPEELRDRLEDGLAAAREGTASRFEAFYPTAKGAPRWWDVAISPLLEGEGDVPYFVVSSRDITERMRAAALRDAVSDEMRHRLKNSYAVAGGIMAAHARHDPVLSAFVDDMLGRFSALGVAQSTHIDLAASRDVADLVPRLVGGFATPSCPVAVTTLPSAPLDQRRIDALAVAFGELAVNSIKHGALGRTGTIAISGTRAGNTVELLWSERGDRPIERKAREGGQGFRLITRVLAPIGGDVRLDWSENGLDARIVFDVE